MTPEHREDGQPGSVAPEAGLDGVPLFPVRRVRCECGACGAHTIVTMCVSVAGCCLNCGSYDLRPVAASDR